MPTGSEVFEQLSWHWEAQLRPRLEGLTDEELHWHPGRTAGTSGTARPTGPGRRPTRRP